DALLALLRHEDASVLADQAAPAQLLDLGHGVDHAHGHVVEGRLDGRGRLAARDEPPALGPVLDEDGLGRGAPAVGGQHRADRRCGVAHGWRGPRGRACSAASMADTSAGIDSRRSSSVAMAASLSAGSAMPSSGWSAWSIEAVTRF